MQYILSSAQTELLLLGVIIFNVVLFVLIIVQSVRIGRLQKRLKKLFAKSNGDNLEVTLERLLEKMDEWEKKQNDQQFVINRLSQKISNSCGHLAVMRYNAFGDVGSDLSYSMALLDDQQSGVIITSIYGREESRTFAKPVHLGKSIYNLSDEELAVLKKASTLIS